MSNVLVVEDEARIASFVAKGLKASGLSCEVAHDGATALALAVHGGFDLMVLDIGLPGMDGFEVLRRLRESGSSMPVIILTARDSAGETIAALEGGADDHMAKPFVFGELLARIRLRLRDSSPAKDVNGAAVLTAAGLSLDLRTREVLARGKSLSLSVREFLLLETFMRHAGQVLSREQLLSLVWGFDFDPGSNVVDVYVRHVRKKIGADAIETVRGMGYRLRA